MLVFVADICELRYGQSSPCPWCAVFSSSPIYANLLYEFIVLHEMWCTDDVRRQTSAVSLRMASVAIWGRNKHGPT